MERTVLSVYVLVDQMSLVCIEIRGGLSRDHITRTFWYVLVRFGEFEKGGLRTTASSASSFVSSSEASCC